MNYLLDLKKNSWSLQHSSSMKAKSMYYCIRSIGHFYCSSGYHTNREHLNDVLLVLTLKGTGYLEYRNQRHILKPNEGFIIDCNEHQNYYTDKKDLWEFIWLHFYGCQSKAYVHEILTNNHSPLFIDEDHYIREKILNIHQLLQEKNLHIDILSSKLMMDMLTKLIIKNQLSKGETVPDIVIEAKEFLDKKYTDKISLDDLCKIIGVSKSYLIRQFKAYTGYSPYEYLLKLRLNEAKTLLIHTNKNINDISFIVGFESVSHFIKYFNQNEKLTPLKFRQHWR